MRKLLYQTRFQLITAISIAVIIIMLLLLFRDSSHNLSGDTSVNTAVSRVISVQSGMVSSRTDIDSAVSNFTSSLSSSSKYTSYTSSINSYLAQAPTVSSKINSVMSSIPPVQSQSAGNDSPTQSNSEKICYLTFDDGPSKHTPNVLKVLEQHDAVATFFVIKNKYSHYMKDIINSGNAIGLHSFSHNYKAIYSSPQAYFDDLNKISSLVKSQTGIESKVVRLPGGSSNHISKDYCEGVVSQVTKKLIDDGYSYFDWNVDSGDASGNNVPVSKIVKNIKRDIYSQQNINVLMHDTDVKQTTIEALPQIISYIRSKGYKFETLTVDSAPIRHQVYN